MYTRLHQGIFSSSGIFQRVMENLLTEITHAIVRRDKIIISGKNDVEHLRNLREVLKTTVKCRFDSRF